MKLPFVNDKPVRLIELFGGIGSQAMALTRLGVNFEHYRLVEFDKYPVASYNAIHGTNFEPTDITKIKGSDLGIVDTEKFTYLLTYLLTRFLVKIYLLLGNSKVCLRGATRGRGYFGRLKDFLMKLNVYLNFCLWKMFLKFTVKRTSLTSRIG